MSAPQPPAQKSWKLRQGHERLAQGLVVSGFPSLPAAAALFLRFDWDAKNNDEHSAARAAAWAALTELAPITDADGPDPRAAALALTFTGLKALRRDQLKTATLESFAPPFREGMFQVDRLRRLGDRYDGEWLKSVVEGGPLWSGNAAALEPPAPQLAREAETLDPRGDERIATPKTVHALLVLYEATPEALGAWAQEVLAALAQCGVALERRLELRLNIERERGVAREHFGFADGVSQPIPFSAETEEAGLDPAKACVDPPARDPWNGAPLGDFLFGHRDSHHETALGPIALEDAAAKAADLPRGEAPEGFLSLGLDGTYLVVRELKQDVAALWRSMEASAKALRAEDPAARHITADWLAARVVGRDRDGRLLRPSGPLPDDADGRPDNDFGFKADDPHGLGCPFGSHVRRANPRDGLARDLASGPTMLASANSHRILRRGRNYGPPVTDRDVDDGAERGLLFMCLNTDIARQFEFIQQNWVLNPSFSTLFKETDPLVGPAGPFTIPEEPLRRVASVDTFVRMAGGEYFFLPSLPALAYLFAS